MTSTVISGYPDTVASDMENVLEHLEGNHADTLQFIATHGLDVDRAEVTDTAITALTPSGVTFGVTGPDGHLERHVDFSAAVGSLPELQGQLFGLILEAREAAPDHPQTSIEREIQTTATLTTFVGQITRVESLSPNLVEITVGGLHDVPVLGGDEFFYLMIPSPERPDQITPGMAMSEIQAIPEDEYPVGASYTTRRRRPDLGELDLWIVLHGHDGGVSGWAERDAAPGATVALWGPRHGYEPPAETTHHLLICDETGLPASCAIIEGLPDDHPVALVAETVAEDHRPPIPSRPGLTVQWVDRGDAAPGTSGALPAAIEALEVDGDGLYAFGAAESREISAVRRHLRNERGLPAAQVHMTGYWRRDAD